MRITPEQIEIFSMYARRYFGEDAKLWLFGSRVDDGKRGGDYDFLVETSILDANEIIQRKVVLLTKLQGTPQFEDENIDIVIKRRSGTFEMPIYQVAMQDGVRI